MAESNGIDLWKLSDLTTPWSLHVGGDSADRRSHRRRTAAVEDLARESGADADALLRLLRQLVSLGLGSFGGRMANAWAGLLRGVRTGRPAYHEVFGRPFWEDLDAHLDIAASFDELMGPAGHGIPDPDVLVKPDWDSVRTVVDVGGGTGTLLAEVLRARPGLRGTLVDLPRVVARSGETFAAAGVADRVTTVGQSFFDPLPAGADLYLLKSVLADWPDAEAAATLIAAPRRRARAAGSCCSTGCPPTTTARRPRRTC